MWIGLEYEADTIENNNVKKQVVLRLVFERDNYKSPPIVEFIQSETGLDLSDYAKKLPPDLFPAWLAISSNKGETWTGFLWNEDINRQYLPKYKFADFTLGGLCERYPSIKQQLSESNAVAPARLFSSSKIHKSNASHISKRKKFSAQPLCPFNLWQSLLIGFLVLLTVYASCGLVISALALSGVGVPGSVFFTFTLLHFSHHAALTGLIIGSIATGLLIPLTAMIAWLMDKNNRLLDNTRKNNIEKEALLDSSEIKTSSIFDCLYSQDELDKEVVSPIASATLPLS